MPTSKLSEGAEKNKDNREHRVNKTDKDELLKEKYAELRLAAAQIKEIHEQIEAVEGKRQELAEASANLNELKNVKKGTKTLTPVTSGIFVAATLDNTSELLVNVGGSVCVKKTAEEANEILKGKLLELTSYQENMLEELNKLTDEADRLEKEFGQMLQEQGEREEETG